MVSTLKRNFLLKKFIYTIVLFILSCIEARAQHIEKVEYYFDVDPGFGRGISRPVNKEVDATENLSIDIRSVGRGFHKIYIRAYTTPYKQKEDSITIQKGGWSFSQSLSFYKDSLMPPQDLARKVTAYEYFFDTDPGFGNGMQKSVAPAYDIPSIPVTIDLTQISAGIHSLYIRFKNEDGKWSLTSARSFYKEVTSSGSIIVPDLVSGEYFYDTDPGFGNGTNILLPATTDLSNQKFMPGLDKLSSGAHRIYTRFQNAAGSWGHTYSLPFFKQYVFADSLPPEITAIEYFIDSDPGFGSGQAFPVPSATEIKNQSLAVDLKNIPNGNHKLYIRALTRNGKWSLTSVDSFKVEASSQFFISIGAINNSLCAGASLTIPFTVNKPYSLNNIYTAQLSNPTGSFNSPVNIGQVSGAGSDSNHATIPANTPNGLAYRIRILASSPVDTSASNNIGITIIHAPDQPIAVSGNTDVCLGAQTYTASPVTQLNLKYSWELSGGGSLDTTNGNATVTWTAQGVYNLKLTSYNACGNGQTKIVQISVFGAAPAITPIIAVTANLLHVPAATKAQGVLSYQWYQDGKLLNGATDSFYTAASDGRYTARYTNPCGIGPESQEVIIGQARQVQTINYPAISDKVFGDTAFAVSASASSGLSIVFKVASGTASVNGNIITINGAGTITIQADQAGNATYAPATSTRTFDVKRANQTIAFDAIADTAKMGSYGLIANASSGLPVSFSATDGGIVTANTLTFDAAGNVTVRASQPGNKNYNAIYVEKLFCVAPGQPGLIAGYVEVCKSIQSYSVTNIRGANFTWSVSEGGRLITNTGSCSVNVEWTELGSHTLTVTASTPCTLASSAARTLPVTVTNTIVPGNVTGLYPNTDTLIESFPFAISWKPSVNAQFYDVYVWLDGLQEPSAPTIGNLSQIGYALSQANIPNFAPGKRYNWKVVARNACRAVASTAQSFRVSDLPNLVVSAIQVPQSVFSGQATSIKADIQNNGKAATKNALWIDAVYLSEDSVLDKVTDLYLGGKNSVTALGIGQSYATTFAVTIPENIQGRYYIIVQANNNGHLTETGLTDNTRVQELRIVLTPPPDLQVTKLQSKLEVFSGQDLPVEWTVANKGTGDTKVAQWKDILYLSADKELNINSAIKLGEVIHNHGILKKDSSYSVNFTASLPLKVFGMHYLYVVTDATNQVLEFSFENNNTRQSDSLNIYLTPPPDFIVSQLNAPAMATSGETIPVEWFVKNQGASAPHKSETTWTDGIYLSQDSAFNAQTALWLSYVNPPLVQNKIPAMKPSDFYNNSAHVTMPQRITGTWYVYVITDVYDQIFEYQRENNNILKSRIELVNPDLFVTSIQSQDSAMSGMTMPVQWSVKNIGHGKVLNAGRQDVIWLSPTAQYDARTAIVVGDLNYSNALDTGSSISNEVQIKLPDTLSGRFFLFAETNYRKYLYEENDGNNMSAAKPIAISLSPFPDLKVLSASLGRDTLVATNKISIHYKVANSGNGSLIGKSWTDRIYLSKEPAWNERQATLIKQVPRSQALMPNDFYDVEDSLEISMALLRDLGIDSLNCYVYVMTDAGNTVFEFHGEDNNIGRTQGLYLLRGPVADLAVTVVTGSDSAFSGKTASVQWSVKNLGAKTGYYSTYWNDGLYLSKDTVLDAGDRAIASKIIYGPLDHDGTYTERMPFSIPNGISGDYYLLLVADQNDLNADKNRTDNVRVVGITIKTPDGVPVVVPVPIHVTLSPTSDLVVKAFQSPSIGTAGQPISIKWQVANQGVGPTTAGGWTERLYLSLDDKIDGLDKVIASYARKGNLDAGAAYSDSMDAILPNDALGNYYLLFQTDNNDVVYEDNAEDNNTASALVFVIQQPPADLVVTAIAAPAQAMQGDTINVSWRTKNIGTNAATGAFQEGLYISRDSVWDKNDILLYTANSFIDLPPLSDTLHTASFRVKGLAAGKHYILVRTDLQNNIFELNEGNNVSASAEMQLAIVYLPLNIVTPNKLVNNDGLFYKIDIADSLAGETLLISLQADSAFGTANELYLKYDSLPTKSNYDFAFSKAFAASQEVVIPDLKTGTYYLMVYGSATAQPQNISLLAKKINFEIRNVTANRGGNTGTVTVKITGARFESGMQVSLANATLGNVVAQSVEFRNSTTLFATFNLSGSALGLYDLKLLKQSNQSAVLKDGFTVVAGSGGGVAGNGSDVGFYCEIKNIGVEELLGVTVAHPDRARVRFLFPMVIKYGNSGNVDVPAPTKTLVCLNGTPVSFTTDDILKALKEMDRTKKWSELQIEFSDPDGINGVLRPGATGSITIYGAAFDPGEVLIFRLLD